MRRQIRGRFFGLLGMMSVAASAWAQEAPAPTAEATPVLAAPAAPSTPAASAAVAPAAAPSVPGVPTPAAPAATPPATPAPTAPPQAASAAVAPAPATPAPAAVPAATDGETERLRLQLEIERTRLEAERLKAQNAATPPAAQPAPKHEATVVSGTHEHDGFFLRLNIGVGIGGYKGDGIADLSFGKYNAPKGSGTVMGGDLLVGQAVAPNLIVHGVIGGTSLYGPENHDDVGPDRELDRLFIGGGVTYYFMPTNFFLTGNVGFTEQWLHERGEGDDDDDGDGDIEHVSGLGLQLTFGKEWWVSPNWGLGVAVQGEYDWGRNGHLKIHQGMGRMLFSATYN